MVEKGEVKLPADQQGQAHLAKIGAFLLVVPPLGKLGHSRGGDPGVEVDRVVKQSANVDPEFPDQGFRQLELDVTDLLLTQVIHGLPKLLACKPGSRKGQEVDQSRFLVPLGQGARLLVGATQRLIAARTIYSPTPIPCSRLPE